MERDNKGSGESVKTQPTVDESPWMDRDWGVRLGISRENTQTKEEDLWI